MSQRSLASRRSARAAAVRRYFYGTVGRELAPSQNIVQLADVEVVEIVGADDDDAILPVGVESTLEPVRVEPLPITQRLVGAVLAVSFAESEDDVLSSNASGVINVTSVDEEAGTMTVLAPCAGPLPGRFLVQGSITWRDL